MLILGIHTGWHDVHAVLFDDYTLLAAIQLERLSREKGHGQCIPYQAVDECLYIAGAVATDIDAVMLSRGLFHESFFSHLNLAELFKANFRCLTGQNRMRHMPAEMRKSGNLDAKKIFNSNRFIDSLHCRKDTTLQFFNHHEAHALPCLFFTDWANGEGKRNANILLYTADGIGDYVSYSHRFLRNGALERVYGGDEAITAARKYDSVGFAYQYATEALGYIPNRHEGKLTGLAAWGEPVLAEQIGNKFSVDEQGQINSSFSSYSEMRLFLFELFKSETPQNVASSIQHFTEDIVLSSVSKLTEHDDIEFLGLSGGIHANVRLNQHLVDNLSLNEVFVFPAMGDCGVGIGGVLSFLLRRDGIETWLQNRYRLKHLYYGRPYGDQIDVALLKAPGVQRVSENFKQKAAKELSCGKVVAIYTKAMEYGPRALGARSILASPTDAKINNTLNKRLSRTEFMPFAPVVSEEDANSIFDINDVNRYTSRFMTITCLVKNEWKERIPAVIHIDGTARPQIITRDSNPLYFDILMEYKTLTGIPVLINTSFNAHEEPIVNTPEECLKALQDQRVDAVVTESGYYFLGE